MISEPVKAALVIGLFIAGAMAAWVYFSPYQSCVRMLVAADAAPEERLNDGIDPSTVPKNLAERGILVYVETDEHRYGEAARECADRLGGR